MPSYGTGREFTSDLPGKVGEVASTKRGAEIGSHILAAAKPRDAMGSRAPPTASDGAKSGSAGCASIEYWFFCGDGVVMRER